MARQGECSQCGSPTRQLRRTLRSQRLACSSVINRWYMAWLLWLIRTPAPTNFTSGLVTLFWTLTLLLPRLRPVGCPVRGPLRLQAPQWLTIIAELTAAPCFLLLSSAPVLTFGPQLQPPFPPSDMASAQGLPQSTVLGFHSSFLWPLASPTAGRLEHHGR